MTVHTKIQLHTSRVGVSVQRYGVFGGSCYIVEADRLTWADARARCEQLGGHLAVIENQAENQFVFELAGGQEQQGQMIGRMNVLIGACSGYPRNT